MNYQAGTQSRRRPPAPRHGLWLQRQRWARGWSVAEMRRRLREAARQADDKLPDNDCLTVMIYRWEENRSGISERYRLHYCRALGIPPAAFGKSPPPEFQPPECQPAQRPPDTLLTLAHQALNAVAALIAALHEGQP